MGNQVIDTAYDTAYGPIAAHFQKAKLADLCYARIGIQTGPFGSQLHQKDYVAIGTPIITVEHLGENRIIHQDLPRVSEEDRKRLGRYALEVGDIVFSRVGAVDRRSLVREEEDGWLFSGRCLRVRPNAALMDSAFLSWFFGLPTFKDYIRRIAVGATMPSLNTEILSNVPIYYPSLPEQRAIAHILGTLDDKIELNRKMNETLEAMAQALFKNWFVDFEPFRDQGMEDSPLGPIPKGWRVTSIGEAVLVVGGSTPSTKERSYWEDGELHWATPKDLASLTSSVLLETERCITEQGLQQISSGLLPKGTVLLSSRAPVGYLAIAEIPLAINQGFIAMVCNREIPNHFVLRWAQTNKEVFRGRANGTTFPEISKASFRPIQIVIPPTDIVQKFTDQAQVIYRQVVNNLRQARTLISIRDTLLPKLLSGEIRVKDAERFLESRL